jgi:type III restriction enzyme
MELKPYQQKVIDDLGNYLAVLEKTPHLAASFKSYWGDKGVTGMDAYKNNVPGVPHVCAKVPTAGGKTYIAVNAIKTIFDAFATVSPNRTQFVVWLAPSLTILEQTYNALNDPEHPYRKRLNQLFRNRVAIFDKRDLLMGAGFSADTVQGQLSIVLMSFDSLRAKNKEDRKIFQDNGYLASFITGRNGSDNDCLLPEHDPSALINVIRLLKPIVVVDESHNAETKLSVEMLINLNPDFILDLTATPRNNSNIISYVDALALKRNHMVKLPVIVANRTNRSEVIESSLILRRQLEEIAKAEEKKGGKYIRPIVLFQAQPRTNDDNTTYEKIKEKLIELKIPAEQIKIKTADINELKGVDLMSRDCQVRYIITINALKEGWDCPFAYVLASLADKSSPVDVEQILGRVLRMPHVQQHGHDLLNLSYVFTASSKFADTLQSVVKALNRAGFSDKDYRTFDPVDVATETSPATTNETFALFGDVSSSTEGADDINTSTVSPDWNAAATTEIDPSGSLASSVAFVEEVKAQAIVENQDFEAKAESSTNIDVPSDLEEKMNKHKLKEIFRNDALALKLPQFHLRMQTGGWFDDENILQIFERNELLRDFKLSHADSNINFEDVEAEMYRVDLEKVGDQDYTPKPFKMDSASRKRFNSVALAGSRDNQVRNVTARITQLIGNMYPITDPEIKQYVTKIVNGMEAEQLQDCLERDVSYMSKIKQKIKTLADAHSYKAFNDLLDVDRIVVLPSFILSEIITPPANAPSLPKSLYATEASMGIFEGRVINDIANLESVEWWHRNLSRGKGFRINGFINHYPDFILKMKSGRIVVLETKGDDRDNTDSEMKLKLGKLWESRCGGNFKYIMAFENNPIEGAERLSDALRKIGQL